MRSIFLALALVVLPAATPEAPTTSSFDRHPLDGPDVDVRIQVQKSAVKFQIIMNLAYVDAIVDTPREDEYSIKKNEIAGIRQTLFEFYKKSNTVKVDGIAVTPKDVGFEVAEGDPDLLPLFPRSMEKALIRVQLSLDYPCKSAPGRVSFAWGEFPVNPLVATATYKPKLDIKAHLIARGLDEIIPLTDKEPEYTWHDTGASVADRFLAVPKPIENSTLAVPAVPGVLGILASLGLLFVLGSCLTTSGRQRLGRRAGLLAAYIVVMAPVGWFTRDMMVTDVPSPFGPSHVLPNDAQAKEIFHPLHRNIYRAFDYVEESEIYDALASSVSDDLLDNLYNQVYRSLIMHEEGGAVSRVQAVRSKATKVESIGLLADRDDRPGFQVHARWEVDGVVRHWNHAHYRTNEYEARYTVVQTDAGWRIADNVVLGQKRIDESSDEPKGK